MAFTKAYLLPLSYSILMAMSYIGAYIVALTNDHVALVLPYVSDTVTTPPESSIFSLIFNLLTIFGFTIVFIKYKQVVDLHEKHELSKILPKLNRWTFYIGILMIAATFVMFNFQETASRPVHELAGFTTFFSFLFYMTCNTVIAFKIYPIIGNKKINGTRAILCGATLISLIILVTTALQAGSQVKDVEAFKRPFWKPEDGGYDLHVISAATEYTVIGIFFLYTATLVDDFKHLEIEEPVIIIKKNDEDVNI